jgi:hypothetical protein
MSDDRLKRTQDAGRQSRASADRSVQDTSAADDRERRRAVRSNWTYEALPTPPAIPGWHLMWLSTTNQQDPIFRRERMGYVPVTAEEASGLESLKITAGDHVGKVGCNEMLLYKIPVEDYTLMMEENHHYAPLEEEEKFGDVSNMVDGRGKVIGRVEGDGFQQSAVPRPKFD